MTLLLLAAAFICAAGWARTYISLMTLSAYIVKKGYTPPSDEETKTCTRYVVLRLLGRNAEL